MHPVTRLGRVIQQLKSFGDLHASELDELVAELETAGVSALATKLRTFRDVQRDEAQMVVDELADLQADMAAAATVPAAVSGAVPRPTPTPPNPPNPPAPPSAAAPPAREAPGVRGSDPAVNSPKRAKWLAEQAAEAERLKAPRPRRTFLGTRPKAFQKDDD